MTPSSLTFLTTYQCTAACRECCFQSSPHNQSRQITLAELTDIIDQAAVDFTSLQLVVFSGGECFLLGEALYRAIAHATERKLLTRCVTNGYWGKQPTKARKMAEKLSQAGLREINFSTGDDHQKYVPVQSVVNAALACALRDIRTMVVVEGHSNSRFVLQDLLKHPDIVSFFKMDKKAANIRLIQNIWIPFNTDRKIEHPDLLQLRHRLNDGGDTGCNQILSGLVITPDLQLASCCGLTLEYIDELKLGKVENNLKELYNGQLDDLMKLWLFTDGPQKILEFVRTKAHDIESDIHAVHPCQACASLFNDANVKRAIITHYEEIVNDVTFRFHLKRERVTYAEQNEREMRCVPV